MAGQASRWTESDGEDASGEEVEDVDGFDDDDDSDVPSIGGKFSG